MEQYGRSQYGICSSTEVGKSNVRNMNLEKNLLGVSGRMVLGSRSCCEGLIQGSIHNQTTTRRRLIPGEVYWVDIKQQSLVLSSMFYMGH